MGGKEKRWCWEGGDTWYLLWNFFSEIGDLSVQHGELFVHLGEGNMANAQLALRAHKEGIPLVYELLQPCAARIEYEMRDNEPLVVAAVFLGDPRRLRQGALFGCGQLVEAEFVLVGVNHEPFLFCEGVGADCSEIVHALANETNKDEQLFLFTLSPRDFLGELVDLCVEILHLLLEFV